ncbi:MAG TPA: adenylosuccinate synthase [Thermodesulfobacteriota bacterium]|nr:adenylosuccinate synthase [Thermodesulfobacteriota bacterium]
MPNIVVVGTQWGDEGKGRIVDLIAESVDIVARYQGGSNAGHTIVIGGKTIVLHHIPSGILREGKLSVIGNGVVLDPKIILDEIEKLRLSGYRVDENNLKISDGAHVVMPYHKEIDSAREKSLGADKIGTTGRGIGPTYEDKAARRGLKLSDLIHPESFRERLRGVLEERNLYLTKVLERSPVDFDRVYQEYVSYGEKLKLFVTDTVRFLNGAISQGKSVLFEGAQGALLDIDFGTYPYVTSSSAAVGGVCTGTGVCPTKIDFVVGVAKAYTTRVGEGPFPSEIPDELGVKLREFGSEYGATTGRPRRCGWFDAVALRYSALINGISGLAITKLDVLSEFDKIKICVGYKYNGELLTEFPSSSHILKNCTPVYEEMDGWRENLSNVKNISDLPLKTRAYLDRIEEVTGIPIWIVSVGASREKVIFVKGIFS